MYYFYVLKSAKTTKLYKGHAQDIDTRIAQHNAGKTGSVRHGIPWKLLYSEGFKTREEALAREKYFKTFKGGKDLKKLLKD